jgi:hypothetical protein
MDVVVNIMVTVIGSLLLVGAYTFGYVRGWHAGFNNAEDVFIAATKENIAKINKPLYETMNSIQNIADVVNLADEELH